MHYSNSVAFLLMRQIQQEMSSKAFKKQIFLKTRIIETILILISKTIQILQKQCNWYCKRTTYIFLHPLSKLFIQIQFKVDHQFPIYKKLLSFHQHYHNIRDESFYVWLHPRNIPISNRLSQYQ